MCNPSAGVTLLRAVLSIFGLFLLARQVYILLSRYITVLLLLSCPCHSHHHYTNFIVSPYRTLSAGSHFKFDSTSCYYVTFSAFRCRIGLSNVMSLAHPGLIG